MGFVDTAKTKLFGDQNNRQDHGFRAGFVPAFAPSLVAAGAVAMGAPAGAVALALAAVGGGAVLVGDAAAACW